MIKIINIWEYHANQSQKLKRNQNLALELVVSDEIVTPTQWQKNQLPDMLGKCHNFDGII